MQRLHKITFLYLNFIIINIKIDIPEIEVQYEENQTYENSTTEDIKDSISNLLWPQINKDDIVEVIEALTTPEKKDELSKSNIICSQLADKLLDEVFQSINSAIFWCNTNNEAVDIQDKLKSDDRKVFLSWIRVYTITVYHLLFREMAAKIKQDIYRIIVLDLIKNKPVFKGKKPENIFDNESISLVNFALNGKTVKISYKEKSGLIDKEKTIEYTLDDKNKIINREYIE